MIYHYRLKGKQVIPCTFGEWVDMMESRENIIKQTQLDSGLFVSTIFLGQAFSFGRAPPPRLFETMVFSDYGSDIQERHSTYDEAIKRHWELVRECSIQTLKSVAIFGPLPENGE